MDAVTIPAAPQAISTASAPFAAEELAKHKFAGASIVVVRAERIVYSEAFGTANLDRRADVTADSRPEK